MVISKMTVTKQYKEECIYHKQLVEQLENDPDYQQLTTNKLNKIFHESGELSLNISSEEPIRKLLSQILQSTKLFQLTIRMR